MRTQRRLKLRSRTGCARCRAQHQKCDEKRPSCSRCRGAGSVCVYRNEHQLSPPRRQWAQGVASPLQNISSGYSAFMPLKDPSHAIFLDYFVRDASAAICCHETIQQDTCKAVVSAGSAFPSLLYSTLLFGALHKASMTHPDINRRQLDIRIMELRASALSLLQAELHNTGQGNSAAVIATTLMLANCELHFDPDASFWRSHFECASLLLADARRQESDEPDYIGLWRLIDRLSSLLEFLVSLPAPWSSKSTPAISKAYPKELPSVESIGTIDGNMACTRDLLGVFTWITALQDMRRFSRDCEISQLGQLSAYYVTENASELVRIVHLMMARDEVTPAVLSDELAGQCDESQIQAFRMANCVAHHIALIFLHRCGLELDRGADAVKSSVASIVQLADAMPKHSGIHPSIVLTTALFVAGCEAIGRARRDIRSLLQEQYAITRNQSAKRTLQQLEILWGLAQDDSGADKGCFPTSIVSDDFVPY
ncbi:hypothetical protein LLEC1_02220 [Akanthomyces lecanii]|uniref:Zn(2)-C6 fungal-type domain-containing protein n=1 Tax=Cordyceps confragosa TaxID=2714763 RepID=A0A179I2L2_CORDF|nr:hypothetical protein LLEC1_02220 [Akanthomyces lecanii]